MCDLGDLKPNGQGKEERESGEASLSQPRETTHKPEFSLGSSPVQTNLRVVKFQSTEMRGERVV